MMAGAGKDSNLDFSDDVELENAKLSEIFLNGWNTYDELETTSLPFNSHAYQSKVKTAMNHLEFATRIVNHLGLFSANEMLDEVATESLQYLLLPHLLGKLTLKLQEQTRSEVLRISEIYFNDFLQRCYEYKLCGEPPKKSDDEHKADDDKPNNDIAKLLTTAQSRNEKIAQYRRKKELEEYIDKVKEAVKNKNIDEEIKREFFIKLLKKSIIESKEELDSIKCEKPIVEMRNLNLSSTISNAEPENMSNESNYERPNSQLSHRHHHHLAPKPKPLQPFIITRNATQKAVFGMGYPSLPVMTVNEFYQQRVDEGIFPDEHKVAEMNRAQAMAATRDPNESEDAENAVLEVEIESDDPVRLERMRRMDEYKDVVRRGDGNRYNRS